MKKANESARQVAAFFSQAEEKQLLHEKDFETLDAAIRKKGILWRVCKFSRFVRARTRNNGRWRRVALIVACVGAVGFPVFNPGVVTAATNGVRDITDQFLAANGISVKRISVNGEERIPDTRIIDIVSEDSASSLLFFDVIAARDKLLALPNVTAVSIRKSYPHTLSFTLDESRPFALWQDQKRFFVIDQGGTIISSNTSAYVDMLSDMPVFVGAGANALAADFMEMLDAYPTIAGRIGAVQRVSDRRWRLHTKDAMRIELPEYNTAEALAELASLDRDYQILDRAIAVLDMRLPDRLSLELDDAELAASLIGLDE